MVSFCVVNAAIAARFYAQMGEIFAFFGAICHFINPVNVRMLRRLTIRYNLRYVYSYSTTRLPFFAAALPFMVFLSPLSDCFRYISTSYLAYAFLEVFAYNCS